MNPPARDAESIRRRSANPRGCHDRRDLFAACALVFLTCTYLVFVALRTTRPSLAQALARIVDALLLVGLTGMTAGAFLMVYTVW